MNKDSRLCESEITKITKSVNVIVDNSYMSLNDDLHLAIAFESLKPFLHDLLNKEEV